MIKLSNNSDESDNKKWLNWISKRKSTPRKFYQKQYMTTCKIGSVSVLSYLIKYNVMDNEIAQDEKSVRMVIN